MTFKKTIFPILLALTIMISFSACVGGGDLSSIAENTTTVATTDETTLESLSCTSEEEIKELEWETIDDL